MAHGLTYSELKALAPCDESFKRVAKLMGGAKKWNGVKIDAVTARKAGATFDDIVWAASSVAHNDKDVERRVRLWLADCAAHVHFIFAKERSDDARVSEAILASRQYARGEIGAAARAAAMAAAWDAARAAARDAARDAAMAAARDAAMAAARAAAWDAAMAAAWDAAMAAARDAAWDAAWDAAREAAWDAEEAWQFDRLILWLSDNEPADWPITMPEKAEAA